MLARLSRIVDLLKKGRVVRLKDLAAQEGVTRKTIQADLDYLRGERHQIAYELGKGWSYLAPPPELSLSGETLFALLVAQKTLATYRGTPFEAPLREAFERFSGSEAPVYRCSWQLLTNAITIKNTGISATDRALYHNLVTGIAIQQELKIRYCGVKDSTARTRRVRPFNLCCVNNSWYLIAHDHEAGAIRTFALPRISSAVLLETSFPKPNQAEIEKAISGSFGIFFEVNPSEVSISFAAEISNWVKERNWHETQKVERNTEGGVVLSMEVGITPEFEQWILSFGELAKVLKPSSLAKTIAKRHWAAVSLYDNPK